MTRPFRFKPSLADTKRANLAAFEAMAHDGMSDAGREHLARVRAETKPKQERGPRKARGAEDGESEATVQKKIIAMLVKHPRVQLVIRTNSGAVNSGGYYVEFNHVFLPHRFRVPWPGVTPDMRISDLHVILIDASLMAVECKPGDWKRSYGISDKAMREQAQENYLAHVRACGGIGIFATCVEDVGAVL